MAIFATVEDVIARWDGPEPLDQIDYIDTKLGDAEQRIEAVAGDIGARIASGRTSAAAVRVVLCDMVIRVLRNVGGVKTQSVGPFSYTLDAQVASGRLFVSREDRRLLGLGAGPATVTLNDPALPHVHRRPAFYEPDNWVFQPEVLSAPGAVTVGTKTASSVVLSWPGVANAVAYQVQFRLSGGTDDWSPVTGVNGGTPTTTVTTVTGLATVTSYEFRVVAVNSVGQTSNPSATVTAVTL